MKHTGQGVRQRSVSTRSAETPTEIGTDLVAEETPIAITYNGRTHAVMMASPIDLEDFARGFSLTEGIINNVAELTAIEVQTAKQGIAVQLSVPHRCTERLQLRERSLAGRAGCGICGLTDIAAAIPELAPLTACPLPSHSAVNRAAEALQQQQVLQQATGGIHGAALCDSQGQLLLVREDVGRHNALDKLIGAALKRQPDTPFSNDLFILMSSRASHELINKCVIAGIGTLVTLSAATSLAIDIAEQSKLNLIGFVRGDRQLIYHSN